MPKKIAKIFHFDSYGKRQEKYDRLNNSSFSSIDWKELELKEPYYFFVPKDFAAEEKYMQGFSVSEIFKEFNSGIESKNDSITMQKNEFKIRKFLEDILFIDIEEVRKKYKIFDTKHWKLDKAIQEVRQNQHLGINKIFYRPFDIRYTILTINSGSFLGRPRIESSKHLIQNNYAIVLERNHPIPLNVYISNSPVDSHLLGTAYCKGFHFPLYLYNTDSQNSLDGEETPEKTPNFDMEVIAKIEKQLGIPLVFPLTKGDSDREGAGGFSPENLLDYIYSVLHSISYRETYKEFLKIDFPRVPFDVSKETFWKLVKLGEELRSWHLLENEKLVPSNFITKYPVNGDNLVEKVKYQDEKVFINDEQYFEGVPEKVVNFYIGGYQPAQKWLKDRKGKNLSYEDILHYGKIILTLSETIRIMEEIEKVFEV